ncbi:hypothetical protein PVAP13_1KG201040 [Panicum virgatum]|uniref:Uncharacterized protein n=1 Tax=Panicum virgatum TaxID=38727 RepID=A0A8T0XKJ9_PANVG|nr:hypothetical protein PVAP13_1KG201040 [Panicum virgatum]
MSGSAPPCTPSPSPAPSRQRPRQRPASPARGLQRPSAPLRWSDGFVAAAPLRAGCETGSGAHCLRHRPFRPRWHSVNGSKLIQKSIYDLSKWCVCPAVTNGCRSWLVVLYVKGVLAHFSGHVGKYVEDTLTWRMHRFVHATMHAAGQLTNNRQCKWFDFFLRLHLEHLERPIASTCT